MQWVGNGWQVVVLMQHLIFRIFNPQGQAEKFDENQDLSE